MKANGHSREVSIRSVFSGALVPIDQVRAVIEAETDADRLADFDRQLEAASTIDRDNLERLNYWSELGLYSFHRLGQVIREEQESGKRRKKGRPKKSESVSHLTAAELFRQQSAKRFSENPVEKLSEYAHLQRESMLEITKAGATRYAIMGPAHVSNNTGGFEWFTPPKFLDAARAVMGRIELDPASSEVAQRTVQADRYYTIEDDGLLQPWFGNVWLNPPYAKALVVAFAERLADHFQDGTVSQAVALVNNATETKWFQGLAATAAMLCFPDGRIEYFDEFGESIGQPLQGQVLLYFGHRGDAFRKQFSSFGFCARPYR